MPADIVTRLVDNFDSYDSVTVETKATLDLGDTWTATPGLEAKTLAIRTNGFDTATLLYRAGHQVKQKGEPYAECPLLDLVGKYCRISIGSYQWHGYIVGQQVSGHDVFIDASDGNKRKYRKQDQELEVLGLEYLLDRRQVDGSVIFDTTRVGRPIAFNAGSTSPIRNDLRHRGNKHDGNNTDLMPVFENGLSSSEEWTAAEIVKYLLYYFPPVDDADDEQPAAWTLDSSAATLLADYRPSYNPQGKTIYQVLNELINPQRGYCWWLEYEGIPVPSGTITIYAESLAAAVVSLPSGGSLPANTDQQSLDYDLDPRVVAVKRNTNLRKKYNRVRARGAPMTSTFTVGFGDSTLVKDWGTADETAYKAAASSTTGYAGLSDAEKKKRNDAFRRQEWLARVFSAFRIPTNWDQKCGNGGATGVTRNWAFADVEKTGSILGGLPLVVNSLRVLARTLLREGVDYQNPTSPVDNNPSTSEPDLSAPFVAAKVATSPDKWQFLHRLTDADFADGTPVAEIKTSYSLFSQHHQPGFRLQANGGPAHTLALNNWATAEPTGREPEIDYTTLIATIACEADTHAEGVYPATPPADVIIEELLIDVGDEYRLDFLPENTVVDIRNGSLVLANASTAVGRLLRDDRDKLEDIARFAYEWYKDDNASLTLTLGQLRQVFTLGTMITTTGDAETLQTINTVIGSISYDFDKGQQTVTTLGDAIDLPSMLT